MTLTNEQIEAAVAWWGTAIMQPTFDMLGPTRGRDPQETLQASFAEGMATQLACQHPVDDAARLRFEAALRGILAERPAEEWGACLQVDYHPDPLLSEACRESGVHESRLPWKTTMQFWDGGVRVKAGYGAPLETLLAAPRSAV